MNRNLKIFIALWFYVGWLSCVYLQVWNWPVFSLIFPVIALATLKFSKVLTKQHLLYLIAVSTIGFAFDVIALKANLILIPNTHNNWFYLTWLLSIWILFSSVLPLMGILFKSSVFITVLAGAVMGPLSYYYGQFFNVLMFSSYVSIIIYSIFWAIFFPLILHIQRTRYEN